MATERKDIHTAGIPVLCQSCEARHNGLCGALSSEELLMLARHTRVVKTASGAELTAEGEQIHSYANVMRGVIKLTKTLEDGRQQIVGLQFAPDFVGRLFADESTVSAVAASDVEVCRVSKAALETMMEGKPELSKRLMRQTLRDLDQARDWMVTLGRKTASEKVATFLYMIATQLDPTIASDQRRRAFGLPLTRGEMADFLGLTIETVSRQLSRLRKDGIIDIAGPKQIEIPDLPRLRARCG